MLQQRWHRISAPSQTKQMNITSRPLTRRTFLQQNENRCSHGGTTNYSRNVWVTRVSEQKWRRDGARGVNCYLRGARTGHPFLNQLVNSCGTGSFADHHGDAVAQNFVCYRRPWRKVITKRRQVPQSTLVEDCSMSHPPWRQPFF